MLGIGAADVEHLASALENGVLDAPITEVRDNAPFLVEITGPGGKTVDTVQVPAATLDFKRP
jgi:hypothetical protein